MCRPPASPNDAIVIGYFVFGLLVSILILRPLGWA
jgi:hypothetical protein